MNGLFLIVISLKQCHFGPGLACGMLGHSGFGTGEPGRWVVQWTLQMEDWVKKWHGIVMGLVGMALFVMIAGLWVRLRADVGIGERLAKNSCSVCHDLTNAKKNKRGPYLWGIVNRPAGSVDFLYSGPFLSRIRDNPVVWTEENLERFITHPALFIPQIQMAEHTTEHPFAFDGMDSSVNRRDLIAWLKTLR